jgi:hypothetical protein
VRHMSALDYCSDHIEFDATIVAPPGDPPVAGALDDMIDKVRSQCATRSPAGRKYMFRRVAAGIARSRRARPRVPPQSSPPSEQTGRSTDAQRRSRNSGSPPASFKHGSQMYRRRPVTIRRNRSAVTSWRQVDHVHPNPQTPRNRQPSSRLNHHANPEEG